MLIKIGFRNYANAEKVLLIIDVNSKPARRLINAAKERGQCIDACKGKKPISAIIMDSGHVVLSINSNVTISNRMGE